jgi:hypothetical protein
MKLAKNVVQSIIVLFVVVCVIIGVIYVSKHYILNDANRLYDEYENICYVHVDYTNETVTFRVADFWAIQDNKDIKVSLKSVMDSNIIVIDNSVYAPTMIDNILHIPEEYPK